MLAKCSMEYSNKTSSPRTISLYSISGQLSEMERTFERLPFRDGVPWNLHISGYSLSVLEGEAVKAYNTMMRDGSGNLTRVSSTNKHISLLAGKFTGRLSDEGLSHIF